MEVKTIRTKNTEYVKISWRDEAEYKRWIGMLQRVCENWKEENAEIVKLLDIFISRTKEDSSTGEYVVCLYTAHLAEITKFFFVFAGISDIQGKMIDQKDSLLKKQDIFIFHKKGTNRLGRNIWNSQ